MKPQTGKSKLGVLAAVKANHQREKRRRIEANETHESKHSVLPRFESEAERTETAEFTESLMRDFEKDLAAFRRKQEARATKNKNATLRKART